MRQSLHWVKAISVDHYVVLILTKEDMRLSPALCQVHYTSHWMLGTVHMSANLMQASISWKVKRLWCNSLFWLHGFYSLKAPARDQALTRSGIPQEDEGCACLYPIWMCRGICYLPIGLVVGTGTELYSYEGRMVKSLA